MCSSDLLELERALAGRNIELLARTAHNIKGTALNLHTPDLTRLAIQAQDSARAKSTTSWEHGETLQVQLRQFLTLVQSQGA